MSALAFALVIAAAITHAAWNIVAHGVSRAGMPFLWWGAVGGTAVWIGVIPFTGGLGTDDLLAFLLGVGVSGVLHVAYMAVLQRGYREGNLSTVYATARGTGPFLSVIVAILLFGERPSVIALVGVAAIIVGVVAIGLVDRGRAEHQGRSLDLGLVFGLLTGVAIAIYTIWDAHAVRTWNLSPVAFMVGTMLLEIPFYSFGVRGRWAAVRTLGRTQWRRIVAFSILSPLSYILVLTAIQIAPVALVAPLREVSVVLVSLFGVFALKESRPGWRLAASAVVAGGIVLLAL
ncbi:drug/metabolite transporter (DMT)-like permease [Microbacterium foliorum]|uniref:Drug/metabolite transporter (DMT)-like permease n=1 Tax=Microbacterium foliorum TaxID=104336 RepID=A0ABU1HSU9_9MICO|nr:EamA family transporter [Microbacterium foliorum]MDR6142718.1 drug/metabolite transporter (DMT)-like permease [Microbacterium foliorum]